MRVYLYFYVLSYVALSCCVYTVFSSIYSRICLIKHFVRNDILTPLLLSLLLLIYAYVLHLHFKYFKVEYMILFAETHIKIYCPLGGYKYAFTLRRCHLPQTKHRYAPPPRSSLLQPLRSTLSTGSLRSRNCEIYWPHRYSRYPTRPCGCRSTVRLPPPRLDDGPDWVRRQ